MGELIEVGRVIVGYQQRVLAKYDYEIMGLNVDYVNALPIVISEDDKIV